MSTYGGMTFIRTGFAEELDESPNDTHRVQPDVEPSPLRRRMSVSFGDVVHVAGHPSESEDDEDEDSNLQTKLQPSVPARSFEDEDEMLRHERAAEERNVKQAREDPRLQDALRLVRKLSSANLKEQCLVTEWMSARTEVEREILLESVADPAFWIEVKETALADAELSDFASPGGESSAAGISGADDDEDVDTESRLYKMFTCFDRDGTGSIGSNQLHQLLLYMGISASEDEVESIVKQCDGDGDGRLEQAEFMLVMKKAQAGMLSFAAPTKQTIRRASFRVSQQQRPVFSRSELCL